MNTDIEKFREYIRSGYSSWKLQNIGYTEHFVLKHYMIERRRIK